MRVCVTSISLGDIYRLFISVLIKVIKGPVLWFVMHFISHPSLLHLFGRALALLLLSRMTDFWCCLHCSLFLCSVDNSSVLAQAIVERIDYPRNRLVELCTIDCVVVHC